MNFYEAYYGMYKEEFSVCNLSDLSLELSALESEVEDDGMLFTEPVFLAKYDALNDLLEEKENVA